MTEVRSFGTIHLRPKILLSQCLRCTCTTWERYKKRNRSSHSLALAKTFQSNRCFGTDDIFHSGWLQLQRVHNVGAQEKVLRYSVICSNASEPDDNALKSYACCIKKKLLVLIRRKFDTVGQCNTFLFSLNFSIICNSRYFASYRLCLVRISGGLTTLERTGGVGVNGTSGALIFEVT